MENLDNIKALAETAIESKNYKQAYQYYSKLLEDNPSGILIGLVKVFLLDGVLHQVT